MKSSLLIGFLVGLAEFVLLWGMNLAGVLETDLGGRLLLFTLFTHALGVIVAMVRLRQQEGAAGFPRLLGAGLTVSFVAAVTAGLGMLLFLQVVEPGYLDWVIESTRQDLADWPDAERAQALAQLDATTPAVYASRGAISYLLRGLLLSLLLAAVLRLRILRTDSEPAGDGERATNGGSAP